MTEISSSSGVWKRSAIFASACSTASRSITGSIRAFFGPTRRRASRTKLRGTAELERGRRAPQPRPSTDEVERGAARTRELARRRPELACLDPLDAGRQLAFELLDLILHEGRRDDRVRALEEVVDDLHRRRARAEAGERIDEALQPVVLLDDLRRRRLANQIRLVVDDERTLSVEVHGVDEALQEHPIVLEGEVALLFHPIEGRDAPGELRIAVGGDEAADAVELLVADRRVPLAHLFEIRQR